MSESETFKNPMIPGDWSDPGMIRVGEDYYSVRSTFGWQPGLHIAHSKDLVHWKYIGFADLENTSDIPHGETDNGVWGSDIGYNPNNKTFLVYAPVRAQIRVFYSEDPAGQYKDGGIVVSGYDPGFFADDDGRLYLTKTNGEIYRLSEDGLRIEGPPIAVVSEGEGPDLFKRDDYYYYVISPGGTRPYQHHMIMSFRSKNIQGPWEEDPNNPVMYAPHTTEAKLQGPGHGEVFQTQNREWYLTYHAYELSHYSLGRQMCIEPIEWTNDGWWRPVNGRIPSEENPVPDLKPSQCCLQDSDDFNSEELGKQWFFHTTPDFSGKFWSLSENPGYLRIKTQKGDISSPEVSKNLFLQRVIYKKFDIITQVTFDAQEAHESAGMHLYHDSMKSIWLTTTVADGKKVFEVGSYDRAFPKEQDPAELKPREIKEILKTVPKKKKIVKRVDNEIGNNVYLKISIDGNETASFFFSGDGNDWTKIDAEIYFGDSWHFSRLGKQPGSPDLGWVGCGRDNVWTGTVMGIFGCKDGAENSRNADFHFFKVNKN